MTNKNHVRENMSTSQRRATVWSSMSSCDIPAIWEHCGGDSTRSI